MQKLSRLRGAIMLLKSGKITQSTARQFILKDAPLKLAPALIYSQEHGWLAVELMQSTEGKGFRCLAQREAWEIIRVRESAMVFECKSKSAKAEWQETLDMQVKFHQSLAKLRRACGHGVSK